MSRKAWHLDNVAYCTALMLVYYNLRDALSSRCWLAFLSVSESYSTRCTGSDVLVLTLILHLFCETSLVPSSFLSPVGTGFLNLAL